MGKKEEAVEMMRKILAIDPKNANALNYIGYSYAEMGTNLASAKEMIIQALDISPDDGYIMDSLGWVYFKMGQRKKALDTMLEAIKRVPDDPVIQEHLGDVYLELGQEGESLRSLPESDPVQSLGTRKNKGEARRDKIAVLSVLVQLHETSSRTFTRALQASGFHYDGVGPMEIAGGIFIQRARSCALFLPSASPSNLSWVAPARPTSAMSEKPPGASFETAKLKERSDFWRDYQCKFRLRVESKTSKFSSRAIVFVKGRNFVRFETFTPFGQTAALYVSNEIGPGSSDSFGKGDLHGAASRDPGARISGSHPAGRSLSLRAYRFGPRRSGSTTSKAGLTPACGA